MQFAERDMQGPLVRSEGAQAVQRQINALPDANAGGANEQERIGRQVAGTPPLLLQELIVGRGKRSGQIAGLRWKILEANQAGRNRVAVVGQILEQTTDSAQKIGAGFVRQ